MRIQKWQVAACAVFLAQPALADFVSFSTGDTDGKMAAKTPIATELSTASPPTVVRTRPVYPYPEVARYNGSGSADDAANFHAVTPASVPPPTPWLGHFPSAPALWCSYHGTSYVCTPRRRAG